MRTCEKCKKVFQDELNSCPYCETKYHDYKEDLKRAMDDLFDEKEITEKQSIISPMKKQISEELLNRLLFLLIILVIVTFGVGAIMIGEKFLPVEPGIVEDTSSTKDVNEENQKDEIIENDIDNESTTTNKEDSEFFVEEIEIKKENEDVKIKINCNSLIDGEIFLKDGSTLNIGPIHINEGKNQFYFLVRGKIDYILNFNASNGKTYEYLITKEMIVDALKK